MFIVTIFSIFYVLWYICYHNKDEANSLLKLFCIQGLIQDFLLGGGGGGEKILWTKCI